MEAHRAQKLTVRPVCVVLVVGHCVQLTQRASCVAKMVLQRRRRRQQQRRAHRKRACFSTRTMRRERALQWRSCFILFSWTLFLLLASLYFSLRRDIIILKFYKNTINMQNLVCMFVQVSHN